MESEKVKLIHAGTVFAAESTENCENVLSSCYLCGRLCALWLILLKEQKGRCNMERFSHSGIALLPLALVVALVLGVAGSASASLVAHYEFEGNADDSSGHGLHGVLIGGATIANDAERGKVLKLDGAGDYVDCGTDSAFNITSSITLACWIKVDAYDKAWQAIITKGDYAWRLQRDETRQGLEFACTGIYVPGTSWGNVLGIADVNDGKWHHVAGVYAGTRISLYVDGVLDYSDVGSGFINTNGFAVLIGENDEQRGREWDGLIDDVRIYDNALSEAEIADLAGAGGAAQADYLTPIAFAAIQVDGTVLSGTPNVSCTFNSSIYRYEITIAGENYEWSKYVTVVTVGPGGGGFIPVTASGNGKLYVYVYDLFGYKTKSDFQFVTYKSPPRSAAEGNVVELTEATFDQVVLNSDVPVLVDFWAPWCGPCLAMAPVIEEIANEYAGKAKVCKLNTDNAPNIIARYNVTLIPTFILFKNGQIQQRWIGITPKEDLTAGIDALL